MTIRSLEELEASLTEDLKWRRVELETLDQLVFKCRPHEEPAIVRSGIALLYAHWEGYVKSSACAYLEHISRKGLKVAQLRHEIAAIALRGVLGSGERSKQAHDHTKIVVHIRDGISIPANLPYDSATIKTNSNLNFATFEDVMHSIGCDVAQYEIFRSTIDFRLVKHRHAIAHGDREQSLTREDWRDIYVRVFDAMKLVRSQVSNSAANKSYLIRVDS